MTDNRDVARGNEPRRTKRPMLLYVVVAALGAWNWLLDRELDEVRHAAHAAQADAAVAMQMVRIAQATATEPTKRRGGGPGPGRRSDG